ncbi:MAG: D-alanine--D-alanine ligase [Fusobacteriaceae bacterium]|nr:D-alanine--D-alanine ligase [Fusobacteriaceae bacterium]MBN2838077.1 D-alanine--D-alanine ligase [Fusobacteriaceae bacterium]
MDKKIRVGIIFGGKSAEHEVALQSAKNVIDAINKDKYEITLIGIDKEGRWQLNDRSHYLLNEQNPKLISLNKTENEVALIPGDNKFLDTFGNRKLETLDVIFPIIHGTNGEDGTIQGMLKLAGIPFVGADVLGSAIGMDKDVAKRLLKEAGIPIADFVTVKKYELGKLDFEMVEEKLKYPMFIKPANAGSSVGVSKASNRKELIEGLEKAFLYDYKVLVEEFIKGREVECAILGNENPIASAIGEIIPTHDFYSYEAKYIDEKGALLEIPAKIDSEVVKKLQEIAIETYKTLCCEGMARVDFFLTEDGKAIINEINTIPGFTKISMYPKLWEVRGLSYEKLIDRLIELAIERNERNSKLKNSF